MKEYLKLVQEILENGDKKEDRTNTGTQSLFGPQIKIDLREGFPLLTTKKVYFSSVVKELLWFLKGKTNINDGLDCKIWDPWADKKGELGPIYGYQWRKWEKHEEDQKSHIDQIRNVIESIKKTPDSRRHIISAWNVADLDKMALPPCHILFQFYVSNGFLDCKLYQRSADVAIGVPFNIASYSLLTHMIAQECNLKPRFFIHTFGDAHIYLNHLDAIKEQLKRTPKKRPSITIANKPLFELKLEDIEIKNYVSDPFIKLPIAV